MPLHFPYRLLNARQAVWSLGGRWVRPKPFIHVTVIGPGSSRLLQALPDTGSDDTVLPESAATAIGVDLTHAPTGTAAGVGSTGLTVRYAEVTLRLTDGREWREWPARVGFTTARLNRPLLGFAGFLQFFTATFHGDREQVELTINRLYPGT